MTITEIRDQFPHTREGIYLNHAGSAPLSRPVVEAIGEYLDQRHRTHVENWEIIQPQMEAVRSACGDLIGADPGTVEFVQNTSEGLSILAEGLDWRPGDRVAIPACEFPANVYPFMNLRRLGVEVDLIPHDEGRVTIDAIARILRPETRLISISWIHFLSGARCDVDAIGRLCRDNGTIFSLDAIQGLGAFSIDVEKAGIDFLSTGTQKWMMGTRGFGFIYASAEMQERLRPRAGWLHGPVDWDNFFDYRLDFYDDARRFRLGTINILGMVALGAALEFRRRIGPARVETLILENASYLARAFDAHGAETYGRRRGVEPESGIVTLRCQNAEALFHALQASKITVSVRNGMLRISPSFYTSRSELDHVLSFVLDSIVPDFHEHRAGQD
jgi:cysteine desulfurase / selenocysteine lyase